MGCSGTNETKDDKSAFLKKNITNNTILMKIKVQDSDVCKTTKILYNISEKLSDCDLKELNESNTELFINGKKYNYNSYFIPEKEGIYEIQLNLKNLMKNCSYLFYGVNLESLDLSSFNAQNVTNMSEMFGGCKNLKNIDLSSFNYNNEKVEENKDMFKDTDLKSVVLNMEHYNFINLKGVKIIYI